MSETDLIVLMLLLYVVVLLAPHLSIRRAIQIAYVCIVMAILFFITLEFIK